MSNRPSLPRWIWDDCNNALHSLVGFKRTLKRAKERIYDSGGDRSYKAIKITGGSVYHSRLMDTVLKLTTGDLDRIEKWIEKIEGFIEGLPENEKAFVAYHYGLLDREEHPPMSLEQCAEELGWSKRQLGYVKQRVINKLAVYLEVVDMREVLFRCNALNQKSK